MTHGLELGTLDLASGLPSDDGYTFSVLAAGFTTGDPQAVVREIVSMLADGNLVSYDRAGNRVVSFEVLVEASDGVALQAGEVALRRELYRPNTVTWTPPSDFAAPTVYEVVTSEMAQKFDDLEELRTTRRFAITLTCAPFARSSTAVTVQALAPPPVSPTTVTVNDATSTTGWSGRLVTSGVAGSSTPAVVDLGVDGVNVSGYGYALTLTYDPPSPVSLSGTPYVTIELAGTTPTNFHVTYSGAASIEVTPAVVRTTPSGTVVYVLPVDPSASLLKLSSTYSNFFTLGAVNESIALSAYDISRTNVLPSITTHQSARSLEVAGTERSPASINIAPGGSGTALGWTIVHTTPETLAGYSPALRQFRTSGNTVTSSSTLMSGGREPVNSTPVVAQVPLASLPEGEYALAALMRSTVVGTFPIFYEARTLLPGVGYLGGTSDIVSATFTATNTWTLIPLDVVTLPPVRSNGAFVQLNLSRTPVAAEVIDLDEWWTLRMGDDCATTILYDNAGFLWLDSPDVSSGVPRIWVGGNSNRSDAHHPSFNLYAQGAHALHPDGTAIFVATSGLEYPNVSATYYPRYHSNAAS